MQRLTPWCGRAEETKVQPPSCSAAWLRVILGMHSSTVPRSRIVAAYDGVRLNYVTGATLAGLDVENSALGIRVNHGKNSLIDQCTLLGTRSKGFSSRRLRAPS